MKTIIQASSQDVKHKRVNNQHDHDNQKHELLKQKVIVNHMISMTKTCA